MSTSQSCPVAGPGTVNAGGQWGGLQCVRLPSPRFDTAAERGRDVGCGRRVLGGDIEVLAGAVYEVVRPHGASTGENHASRRSVSDDFPRLVSAAPALPSCLRQALSPLSRTEEPIRARSILGGSAPATLVRLLGSGLRCGGGRARRRGGAAAARGAPGLGPGLGPDLVRGGPGGGRLRAPPQAGATPHRFRSRCPVRPPLVRTRHDPHAARTIPVGLRRPHRHWPVPPTACPATPGQPENEGSHRFVRPMRRMRGWRP
jgi:hypothetical protein